MTPVSSNLFPTPSETLTQWKNVASVVSVFALNTTRDSGIKRLIMNVMAYESYIQEYIHSDPEDEDDPNIRQLQMNALFAEKDGWIIVLPDFDLVRNASPPLPEPERPPPVKPPSSGLENHDRVVGSMTELAMAMNMNKDSGLVDSSQVREIHWPSCSGETDSPVEEEPNGEFTPPASVSTNWHSPIKFPVNKFKRPVPNDSTIIREAKSIFKEHAARAANKKPDTYVIDDDVPQTEEIANEIRNLPFGTKIVRIRRNPQPCGCQATLRSHYFRKNL